MPFGRQVDLKRVTGEKRDKSQEFFAFQNYSSSIRRFTFYNVTKQAGSFLPVIIPGRGNFFLYLGRDERKSVNLPVGMMQGNPDRFPLVFKYKDILDIILFSQFSITILPDTEQVPNTGKGHLGQSSAVLGRV